MRSSRFITNWGLFSIGSLIGGIGIAGHIYTKQRNELHTQIDTISGIHDIENFLINRHTIDELNSRIKLIDDATIARACKKPEDFAYIINHIYFNLRINPSWNDIRDSDLKHIGNVYNEVVTRIFKIYISRWPNHTFDDLMLLMNKLSSRLSCRLTGKTLQIQLIETLIKETDITKIYYYDSNNTIKFLGNYGIEQHAKDLILSNMSIALMNEEYDEAERMGQHMNKAEKQRQFMEIFPDGEMRYPQVLAKAEVLLNDVLLAVTHDNFINGLNPQNMSDVTRRALKSLRDYIKPSPSHIQGLIVVNVYEIAHNRILANTGSNKSIMWFLFDNAPNNNAIFTQ